MWFELFIFGGFWFWALVAAFVIAEISCVHNDSPFLAGFFVLVLCGLLFLFGEFATVLKYCFSNPGETFSYVLAYFAIGIGWSLIKWYKHVSRITSDYNAVRDRVLKENKVENVGDLIDIQDSTRSPNDTRNYSERCPKAWLKSRYEYCVRSCTPSNNKSTITTWILYWVISLLWDCLETLTIRLVDAIYDLIKSMYSEITKRLFRRFEQDFENE